MDDIYDLVIVGFEPAALSLAIAVHEQPQPIKVLILDPRPRFSWTGSNCPLPGARMKTSLLQDLVTPRNPMSNFTFVNYLWSTGNLVDYTNLSLINPPKRIFSHYLTWAVAKVEALDLVRYDQAVSKVEPLALSDESVSAWRISVNDTASTTARTVDARRIVMAVPPEPVIPSSLDAVKSLPNVVHASQAHEADVAIRERKPTRIAILGANDEAVELLEHFTTTVPDACIKLYPSEPMLRQTDNNSFLIDAIQQPGRLPHEIQGALCAQGGVHSAYGTNQTVDSASISKMYLSRYTQTMRQKDRTQHKSQICTLQKVKGATRHGSSGQVQLRLEDVASGKNEESEPFDYIIAASGYIRTEHTRLMQRLCKLLESYDGGVTIDSNYKVNLKHSKVNPNVGIWILDGLESQNTDVFSYLALRTERVLQSILDSMKPQPQDSVSGAHGPRAAL